jgi:hypothetical protein
MLGSSKYERFDADYYPTIEANWIIPILDLFAPMRGIVWEPACGEGHMAKAIADCGHNVLASDLHDRGYGQIGQDFLSSLHVPTGVETIVTNPPYSGNLIERFVQHALSLTEETSGMVAMLVRNEYDSAKTRQWMFRHPAFMRKIVLTKRPRWIEGEGASPRHTYAWLVWDWSSCGQEPVICWGGPQDLPAGRFKG